MSGVVGIYRPDGRPVREAELATLLAPIRHRGPDRSGSVIDGSIGLAVATFDIAPTSETRQPHRTRRGRIVAFDGRLDNRSEIRALLGKDAPLNTAGDAELIGAAFDRFDDECLPGLKGDFAIAVADPEAQRLWLARDALGVRPLYYCRLGRGVIFGSEVKALVAHPGAPVEPNRDMIAEYYLAGMAHSASPPSFFRGIEAVPPSHVVRFDSGAVVMRRYWDFVPSRRVRLGSFEEYAEAYLELFETAVERRTRSTGPVAVSLSGGLDSSAIACLGATIRGVDPRHGMFAVSYSADDGGQADERPYIEAVRQQAGLDVAWVDIGRDNALEAMPASAWAGEAPIGTSMNQVLRDSASTVKDRGARVLLTGHWGDDFLGDESYLVDLVRRGKWLQVRRHLRELPSWTRDSYPDTHLRAFKLDLMHAFLPDALKPAARKVRDRLNHRASAQPWYSHDLIARVRARPVAVAEPSFGSNYARSIYRRARSRGYQIAMVWDNAIALNNGIEMVFPYLDRDLIEFLMAIPGENLSHGGVHRAILRTSMGNVLPRSVAERRWKGDLTRSFNEAVGGQLPEIAAVLESPGGAIELGMLDRGGVKQLIRSTIEEPAGGTTKWRLIEIAGLDAWARAFFGADRSGAVD
jgi:asparagine synthase (glutamine-hydrolysing)